MFKNILATVFILFVCSGLYAVNFEKHTLGFGVEGGLSATFPGGRADNGEAWHELYGTLGGSFYYQNRFNKSFALRPGVAVYTYFFGIPWPMEDMKDDVFATLNSRIELGFVFYLYTGRAVSLPLLLTPYFSIRFADTAGTYEFDMGDKKEDLQILSDFYSSLGGQISFGIERSKPRKLGVGFYLFVRVGDDISTGGQPGVPCSLGGNVSLFW